VHQARLLADFLPEDGAVACPQNGGQQIEHGRIGMREPGDLPGQPGTRQLDVFEEVAFPWGKRQRFLGHPDRRESLARGGAEMLLHLRTHAGRIDIAHDDDHEVVGHVAGLVVGV